MSILRCEVGEPTLSFKKGGLCNALLPSCLLLSIFSSITCFVYRFVFGQNKEAAVEQTRQLFKEN